MKTEQAHKGLKFGSGSAQIIDQNIRDLMKTEQAHKGPDFRLGECTNHSRSKHKSINLWIVKCSFSLFSLVPVGWNDNKPKGVNINIGL